MLRIAWRSFFLLALDEANVTSKPDAPFWCKEGYTSHGQCDTLPVFHRYVLGRSGSSSRQEKSRKSPLGKGVSGFAGHHVPSPLALYGAMAAPALFPWAVFFLSRDNRRRCLLFVFVLDIVEYLFMLVRSMSTRIPQARLLGILEV